MTTKLRRYNQKDLPLSQQTKSILVPDSVISNDSTSLQFAGYDSYGYEVSIQESLLWIQENFAGTSPPEKAVKGQIWYNSGDKFIYVYDGEDYLDGGDSTNIANWVKPVDVVLQDLTDHVTNYNNPHNVTKTQVGLGNVADALQLIASNNLSDLTNVVDARTNLDVYSTSFIDNNFNTISNTSTMIDNALNSTNLFLRSTTDNNYAFKFNLSNDSPISFTNDTGTPLKMCGNAVRVTTNDDGRDFNIKCGVDSTPGSLVGDKFLSSDDGATLIACNYKGKDGSIILAAKNTGPISGTDLDFDFFLEIKEDSLKWLGSEVVTVAGAAMLKSLVAGTTGVALGSPNVDEKFSNVHSLSGDIGELVTSEIEHIKTVNDISFSTSDSLIAYKNNDNKVNYVSFNQLTTSLSSGIGDATETNKGIAKIAKSDSFTRATTNNGDIVTPTKMINAAPTCKMWVCFDGYNNNDSSSVRILSQYNVSTIEKLGVGRYKIYFQTPMSDTNYCTVFGNTAGKAGTNGSVYSTKNGVDDESNRPFENGASSKTESYIVVSFGNGTEFRDVGEANIVIYGN